MNQELLKTIRQYPEDAKNLREQYMVEILDKLPAKAFIGLAMFAMNNVDEARRALNKKDPKKRSDSPRKNEKESSRGKENEPHREKEIKKNLSKVEKKRDRNERNEQESRRMTDSSSSRR